MILKIFISQFSASFSDDLQLISFLKFFCHFRVNHRSSRANEYFSGLADIILDRFQKQKMNLNIFLRYVFLKGKNFALGLKASSFSNEYILFSFDSFNFSIFLDDFVCVLAGNVQLICWSGRVRLSFSFNSLNCNSGLVLLCFFTSSNKKMFRFTSFCRLFNILRDIFLTSLG